MKSRNTSLIFGLGLLLIGTSAQGLMSTDELLSICDSGLQNPVRDNPKYAFCTGALLGILTADAIEKDLICVPGQVDTQSAMRLFVQRANREPHKNIEGFVTMHRALLEAYPCKKK